MYVCMFARIFKHCSVSRTVSRILYRNGFRIFNEGQRININEVKPNRTKPQHQYVCEHMCSLCLAASSLELVIMAWYSIIIIVIVAAAAAVVVVVVVSNSH